MSDVRDGSSTAVKGQQENLAQAEQGEAYVNFREGQDYDSDSDSVDEIEAPPPRSRKPGNNAFRQQRLKAYNPVMTAKTVIPLLIIIAIIFVPLGAGMWYASHTVQDISIDYSLCEKLASFDHWSEISDNFTTFNFRDNPTIDHKPQWRLEKDNSQQFEDERNVCKIQFEVPHTIKAPLYLFYRLHNFHNTKALDHYFCTNPNNRVISLVAGTNSVALNIRCCSY